MAAAHGAPVRDRGAWGVLCSLSRRGHSPGHLDQVEPAPPAPNGERLGDSHCCCTAGLGPHAIISSGVLRLQTAVPQESCTLKDPSFRPHQGESGLKPHAIVALTGDLFQKIRCTSIDLRRGNVNAPQGPPHKTRRCACP